MAEYKGRRARRASGGNVGEGESPPHGHMIIMIGLGAKKPKKKAGGHVEGKAARRHLGKRARGGRARDDDDDDARDLDAREDANDPDGRDKVSRGSGTEERADEMRDARARGGRLTAAERHKMPAKEFALPGHGEGPGGKGAGSYPIPDASHARSALSRVAQHGSPKEQRAVRAAVHRRFPAIGQG